jgi:hypothetical protein
VEFTQHVPHSIMGVLQNRTRVRFEDGDGAFAAPRSRSDKGETRVAQGREVERLAPCDFEGGKAHETIIEIYSVVYGDLAGRRLDAATRTMPPRE